jgi:hypothetical protein
MEPEVSVLYSIIQFIARLANRLDLFESSFSHKFSSLLLLVQLY